MDEKDVEALGPVPDITGMKLTDIVVNPRLAETRERVMRQLQDKDKYTAFGNTP